MRDGAVIYQEKGPLVAAHGLPGLASRARSAGTCRAQHEAPRQATVGAQCAAAPTREEKKGKQESAIQ